MILKNINSTLILLLITFSSTFAQNVSLEIQNVDLEAGTLEVHMANDVAVGGYQFELFGISIVNATAPSGFFGNNSANSMLGFSLSGATIPAGSAILSTVTFSDYLGDTICFGTENSCASASPNVISDSSGGCIDASWGECYGADDEGGELTDGCDLPNSEFMGYLHLTSEGSVLYKTPIGMGGFQFYVDGATVSDGFGGDSDAAGLTINVSGDLVLAFSIFGGVIPAGCGTLIDLVLEGNATGLSGIVVADQYGAEIPFEYFDGDSSTILGCMDDSACNYDVEATEDDGSCTYSEENFDCDGNCTATIDCAGDCGGDAEYDECGICDADSSNDCVQDCLGTWGGTADTDECGICYELASGASNWNTTCADCLGVPNGNAELDACGTCDADSSNDCVQDCAGVWGGSEVFDECGVCGGDGSSCASFSVSLTIENVDLEAGTLDVYMVNEIAVGGYQFELFGISIVNATAPSGFFGNNSANSMLGFSLSGATIPAGSAILSTVTFSDYLGDTICFGTENSCASASPNVISDSSGGCIDASWGECYGASVSILGCTDSSACNYDMDATEDDGGCTYAEENFDCDGNCTATIDCAGDCGGDAEYDECAICDGDNSSCSDECGIPNGDGSTCVDPEVPSLFEYNSSTLQAFYFYYEVRIGNELVEANDWVGAFKGDICVGAVQWDVSMCGSGICSVPVMGSDGFGFTDGYMEQGDIPSFKIYDSSEDIYYDAIPSENFPWSNFGFYTADYLSVTFDCAGVAGGTSYEDMCGICDDDPNNDCVQDCAGTWGGIEEIDECGVCGGFGVPEGDCDCFGNIDLGCGCGQGANCDGTPSEFIFNQSTLQAFYYISDVQDLYAHPIESDDWIAAFNGDVCVGSRKWDQSLCLSSQCDLPVMGDDGYSYSEGYLNLGDLPSFRLYDVSEDEYFDLHPTENFPFYNANINFIDTMVIAMDYEIDLHVGANFISFYGLPENDSTNHVFESILPNLRVVLGSGESAYYTEDGNWIGSLGSLNLDQGYWVVMENDDTLIGSGSPYDLNRSYDLDVGANMVSFPSKGSFDIGEALPDDIEDDILAIIGEGIATVQAEDGWYGALDQFSGNKGYWFITSSEISFTFNVSPESMLPRQSTSATEIKYPEGLSFMQSSRQSFYFIDKATIDDLNVDEGDWLVSMCGSTIAGSRQYFGESIDIPVMGNDGSQGSVDYCDEGEIPKFKIYDNHSGELIDLFGNVPAWTSNGIEFLNTLVKSANIPESYEIFSAYPNPFNPVTNFVFTLQATSDVIMNVCDLQGREVAALYESSQLPSGSYSVVWDASLLPSGVYVAYLQVNDQVQSQKIVLLK